MTMRGLSEKHPKITTAVKVVIVAVGVVTVRGIAYKVLDQNGYRLEFTSAEERIARISELGYAGNVLNGVHGAQARGLSTAKAQAEYDAIISPYI